LNPRHAEKIDGGFKARNRIKDAQSLKRNIKYDSKACSQKVFYGYITELHDNVLKLQKKRV
jgi:hypothetical protein